MKVPGPFDLLATLVRFIFLALQRGRQRRWMKRRLVFDQYHRPEYLVVAVETAVEPCADACDARDALHQQSKCGDGAMLHQSSSKERCLASEEWAKVLCGGLSVRCSAGTDACSTKGERNPCPFSAYVVYAQPSYKELRKWFPGTIEHSYGKYEHVMFLPVERCRNVDCDPRLIRYEYVYMEGSPSIEEVYAEMDRRGLRPSLYEEFIAFIQKYLDEPLKHPIAVIGSEHEHIGFACVFDDWGGLYLGYLGFNEDRRRECRFLAVREQQLEAA